MTWLTLPSRNRDTIVKKREKKNLSQHDAIYLSRSFFPFARRPRHAYRTRLKFPECLLSPPLPVYIYIYTGEEVLDIGTACGARLVMQMLRIDVGGTDVREGCRGTTSFSGLTEKERQ